MTHPAVIDTARPPARPPARTEPPHALLAAVTDDAARLGSTVNLAAFENALSRTARAQLAGPLADRYLIGQEHERGLRHPLVRAGLLSAGYPGVDRLERAAVDTLTGLLGAGWADFRPLSGLHATTCTFALLTEPGQLVYSIAPENGGHFATRPLLHSLGRRCAYLPWDAEAGTVDLAGLAAAWRSDPGAMVFLDHGVPLVPLPVAGLRAVTGTGPLLVYDASHTLGLIVGGAFQDPLGEGCDIVQGNTHKSFPGAHKGVIAFADAEAGRRFSERMGGALVSSQQTGATLANYVTALEMGVHAPAYARQMLANRAALAYTLREAGFAVHRPAGAAAESRSHVLLVDGAGDRSGYELAGDLVQAGIVLNARPVEGRIRLRIGVQEVTRRGMRQREMELLADLMARAARGPLPGRGRDAVTARVRTLAEAFGRVHYAFDDTHDTHGTTHDGTEAAP